MNRLPLYLSIVAILATTTFYFFYRNSNNLVYVDVNKLIEGYKRTKDLRAQFEKKTGGIKTQLDTLQTRWQAQLTKYERERTSLNPKELKLEQELLSNKQREVNTYQQNIQKQIQEEDKKTTQTIINDIDDYIKEYGKSHNYKMIFGANGAGNIMFADESTDLTEKVLKGLNEKYSKN